MTPSVADCYQLLTILYVQVQTLCYNCRPGNISFQLGETNNKNQPHPVSDIYISIKFQSLSPGGHVMAYETCNNTANQFSSTWNERLLQYLVIYALSGCTVISELLKSFSSFRIAALSAAPSLVHGLSALKDKEFTTNQSIILKATVH